MYTDIIVRLRCGAFLLTLLVASAPIGRALCELVCPQPLIAPVSGCHDGAADRDATAMRGQSHACGETHVDSLPAILTADSGRAQTEAFTTLLVWLQAGVEPISALTPGALAVHGPPGSVARSPKILTTILRI